MTHSQHDDAHNCKVISSFKRECAVVIILVTNHLNPTLLVETPNYEQAPAYVGLYKYNKKNMGNPWFLRRCCLQPPEPRERRANKRKVRSIKSATRVQCRCVEPKHMHRGPRYIHPLSETLTSGWSCSRRRHSGRPPLWSSAPG